MGEAGPAEDTLVLRNYSLVGEAEVWSIMAEPQHLCGKAPLLWGSYDLDRLCARSEKSKRIQKVVQRFGVRKNIEETAHWRQNKENRGNDWRSLEIPNGKSELVRTYQMHLGSHPPGYNGS